MSPATQAVALKDARGYVPGSRRSVYPTQADSDDQGVGAWRACRRRMDAGGQRDTHTRDDMVMGCADAMCGVCSR